VRDFVLAWQLEPDAFAWQHSESLVLAVLIADFKQQLHSQANAEKWFAGTDRIANRPEQLAPPQLGHCVAECAYAR
jgi:hypothetical protein